MKPLLPNNYGSHEKKDNALKNVLFNSASTTLSTPKSVLDVEVSIFKNYDTATGPVTISLLSWLTTTKYKTAVENIREEEDKARRAEMKAELPGITLSGIFSHRKAQCLLKHSKLICIDVDREGNEHIGNFTELKEQIGRIKNVAYCGLSVSGGGYFVIIPIANAQKHVDHFRALQRAFKGLGITVDPRCGDVSRLRGASFDDTAYFNHNAVTFKGLYSEPRPLRIVYKSSGDNDAAHVESCLNQIIEDFTAGYDTWFEIGCALSSRFGENGREYFHQASRFYDRYSQTETDTQFDKCLKAGYSKITLATFFHHCKNAGIEPERKNRDFKPTPSKRSEPEYDFVGTLIDPILGYPESWKLN